MATTPEGKVKKATTKFLIAQGLIQTSKASEATPEHKGKFHMPVSIGMGVHGIPDYYGHYRGFYFEIEAKGDVTQNPTPLQQHQLSATDITGGKAFVVRCPEDLQQIKEWFDYVDGFVADLW